MDKGKIIAVIIIGLIALVIFDPGTREWVLGAVGIGSLRQDEGLSGEVVKGSESHMVKVTRFDNVYHKPTCPELKGKPSFYTSIDKAREMYKPCPKCNPPK